LRCRPASLAVDEKPVHAIVCISLPSLTSRPAGRPSTVPCHDRVVISFVIPAHDEACEIRGTLDALHDAISALSLEHEVVVVADACSDDTAAIAAGCGARVLVVDHRHIAATRNSGARHATGDCLVFVDADTCVDAALLGAAVAALREGAVGGGAAVRLSGATPHAQPRAPGGPVGPRCRPRGQPGPDLRHSR
jgi:cellulose synthase/poly-beta-1,6-N-acetylglucosamine synthase-like glycosyltransferase